ncbi:radical SAM protein [Candidatus Bathyarchaeota archaeon]|nr:radical SAM protein [Candidatus Bathyarchaeota archaeon]
MDADYPEALQIEVTNRCNFNCQMCIRRVWDAKMGDLNLDLYRRVAKTTFPHLRRLILYGLGEPFANPNFIEMLKIAREELPGDSEILISTNGSLLDPRLTEKILRIGVDNISFSIDTTDVTKLKYIREGSEPTVILRNFKHASKMKKNLNGTLRLGAEAVVMIDNFMDLPNLVKELSQEEVDYILISHIMPYTEEMFRKSVYIPLSRIPFEIVKSSLKYDWNLIRESIRESFGRIYGLEIEPKASRMISEFWNEAEKNGYWINLPLLFYLRDKIIEISEDVERIFEICRKIAHEYGVEIKTPNLYPDAKERRCPYVDKNTAFIRSDGTVAPCLEFAYSHPAYVNMHAKNVHAVTFGNLKEENVEKIWGEKAYVSFRETRRKISEKIPWCGDCLYSSLGCYFTRTNSSDCYANEPGCNECFYSVDLVQCNIS